MFRLSVLSQGSELVASVVHGGAAGVERCRGVARWLAGPVIALCLLAGAGVGRAQSDRPNTNWWVPDGQVRAVAVTDSTVYLGGDFNRVGPNTGQGVPLDLSSAQPWADYPRVSGAVSACVADGAGGWYIGGKFTKVGGVTRNRLAHILADGTLDPVWNPDCGGTDPVVFALAVDSNTVYAGGQFTTVNGGTARKNLAAFNTSDGTATAWNLDCNWGVNALALSADGGTVYAGGDFTTVNGGTVRHHLAAFNTTDGTATAWNPDCNWGVGALALSADGGTVYAGGSFTTVNGSTTRNSLAAFNTSDGTATAWNPDCSGGNCPAPEACSLALSADGGTVYAGGWFDTVNGGTARNNLAAFNTTDGTATAWNPDCSGWTDRPNVYTLAVSADGGTVYAGGCFTSVNGGTRRNYLAAFSTSDGTATPWNPECGGRSNAAVFALAISGSAIYAGGDFITLGSVTRNGLAALDRATGQATAWNPGCDGYVYALAVAGSTVYAGGWFTTVNVGTTRNDLAAFNTTDGTATAWNPDCDDQVYALAVVGSTVYAGGGFTTVNGSTTRYYLAAFNTSDGTATAWNPDCGHVVYALALANGVVYAGGFFHTVNGGTVRNCLAAFNTADSTATDWNPNCGDEGWGVTALAMSADGRTVYAGGGFYTVNGSTTRNGLAAFNTSDGAATAWNPGCSGNLWALAASADGGTVYVGGEFDTVNGSTTRNNLAAFNTTDGTATAWNPDCDKGVFALAVAGSTVYAGGSFFSVGGFSCPNFAVFETHQPPVAHADSYSTGRNVALTVAAPGVLANDTDANGDPLTALKLSDPAHGTLTLNADGSFLYTPASGYVGTDSFTYKANDGALDSNVATVSITVHNVDARADVNHDGVVNALDLQIVIANFGKTVGSPGCDARADANVDGVVNALDLQIVIANFGQTVP